MEKDKEHFIQYGISYYPDDDMLLLMRCPKCNRENYAIAVAQGICSFCGYNAHKDPDIQNKIKNILNNE